jgi:hypothetical protein
MMAWRVCKVDPVDDGNLESLQTKIPYVPIRLKNTLNFIVVACVGSIKCLGPL